VEQIKSEGANLGGMNCKSTGKSVAFYLGVKGLAPKKNLSPEIKNFLLFSKLSSYACSIRDINHDCSIRISQSFATKN